MFLFCSQMVLGISVLDVNDNDPTFLNLPGNVSLSEDSGVRSVVLQVIATDADAGANALLSFSISAGNVGGAFSIHTKVTNTKCPYIFGHCHENICVQAFV